VLSPTDPWVVTSPAPVPPRRRRRVVALAGGVVVALLAAGGAVVALRDGDDRAPQSAAEAPRVLDVEAERAERLRARAVRQTLADRAKAVTSRDRAAFLATLDPSPAAAAFRAQQAQAFDGLLKLPIGTWSYVTDDEQSHVIDARLERLRGKDVWAPAVVLHYALKGFDSAPARAEQYFTFVPRGDRWLIASDDDFRDVGLSSDPGMWDGGELVVVKGKRSLVLGHPRSRGSLRTIADSVDAAVPRVTSVVGTGWAQKVVVLVPDSTEELRELLDRRTDFSQISAVATSQAGEQDAPVGARIIVNPPNFLGTSALTRRLTMTHEVTHVAVQGITGFFTPSWLSEGFAEHVGGTGVDLDVPRSVPDLRAEVRAGRTPTQLPTEDDFEATNEDLGLAYSGAWLAVRLLVKRHGKAKVLQFFRETQKIDDAGEGEVAKAFQRAFGRDLDGFTREWSASLRRELR
jgi:hypothetical protein